jgi:hypothetical protein
MIASNDRLSVRACGSSLARRALGASCVMVTYALLMSLVVSVAHAQSRDGRDGRDAAARESSTGGELEIARAIYREARALHRQGKHKEALARYQAAYRAAATPVTALELGRMLTDAGRLLDAYDVLNRVADLPVSPRESERGRAARIEARALASALRGKLATRVVEPAIAAASAEGTPAREMPVLVETLAPQKRTLDPHAANSQVDGPPCSSAMPSPRGGLPSERAMPCRTTSREAHDLGNASGGKDVGLASLVVPTAALLQVPASTGHVVRWLGVGLGGIGAAAVTTGLVVALGAKSKYDAVSADCGPTGCGTDAFRVREDARATADMASIAVGVGATALVSGALLFLLDPHGEPTTPRPLQVGFSPKGVSLSLTTM